VLATGSSARGFTGILKFSRVTLPPKNVSLAEGLKFRQGEKHVTTETSELYAIGKERTNSECGLAK
jgi:hypothetical protein